MAIARGEITITELYDGDNFYRAWADTPDGSGSSFTTEESNRAYLGVYSGREEPTHYSQYKWSRIRGESAITAILSNDSHQIGTDENGDYGNYIGAKTTVAVFHGGEDDTSNWKIDSIQVEPIGAVTGKIIDTYTYKVEGMTEDEASVTFALKHKDNQYSPLEKVFTLSKNKQGISGQHATSYHLNFNDTAIKKIRQTKTMEPTELIMRGMSITKNQKSEPQAGFFKIYEQSEIALNRDEYEQAYINGKLDEEEYYVLSDKNFPLILTYTSKEPEESLTYNYTDLEHIMSIKVYWYLDDLFEELVDVQTILVTSDGEKGDTGDAGKDAISAVLTNESITFAADKDGVVQNYVGNTGNFLLMEGIVNKSAETKFSRVSQTNVSAAIDEDNGSYIISSMEDGTLVTTGQATFRAVYKGTTIDKTVTISKSIAGQTGGKGDPGAPGGKGDPGAPGAPATSYWLTSSVDTITVKYNGDYDPKTITYYGHSKTGSNNTQNYAGRFIIQTSIDGVNFTQAYISQSNTNKVDFSVPEDSLFIKAKFYQAGGTTYLLDEQTTPILHSADGLKGVGLEDKDYQVGTEIFTDKADDSVVHVEIDGKSYQHARVDSKNLAPNPEHWNYSSGASYDGQTGEITLPINGVIEFWVRWDGSTASARLTFDTIAGEGFLWQTVYYDETRKTQVYENSNSWKANGMVPRWTTNPTKNSSGSPQLNNNTKWLFMRFTGSSSYSPDTVKIENIALRSDSVDSYEPPAPTPDYPIEIHSVNDFDVVSSVGKRNLLPNSDFSKSETSTSFTVNGKTYNQYPERWVGYNSGITNPNTSYHAYLDSETFGFNTLVFNESNGARNWKGVSPVINSTMNVNDREYVLSANVNTTKLGSRLFGGFFYCKKGATARGFHSGQFSMSPTIENEWQTISSKVPFPRDIDLTKPVNFYLYGYNFSSNSIIYIRNIKLEVGNSPTSYSPATEDISESDNHPLIDKINLLLSEPLRSVGDVKDRLFRDDSDGLWKIERNIGVSILNGSEGWIEYGGSTEFKDNNNVYISTPLLESKLGFQTSITSHLVNKNMIWHDGNTDYYSYSDHATVRTKYFRLPLDVSLSDWKNWLSENPVTFHGQLATPVIETLSQTLQDKLNNLRSFENSNYVYTIINEADDLPSHISENLKPALKANFKGGGWYGRFRLEETENKTSEVSNLLNEVQATATIQVGMKVGYSGYNTQNANAVYLCGIEYNHEIGQMVLVDKPGSIYVKGERTSYSIDNQVLMATGLPQDTTAYIIYDNLKKSVYFIYFESKMADEGVEVRRWRDISGNTINLTDSHFAIGEVET